MPGTTIAIASGKGGVGKTVVTLDLGVALHRAGAAVTLVDLDLGMANLATALGFEPDAGIQDVLAGSTDLDSVTLEAREGRLLLIPGVRRLDRYAEAPLDGLQSRLAEAAQEREFVLLDTSAGLSAESVRPLELADEVVLVSTPDRPALENTQNTQQLAWRAGTPIRGAIINRVRDPGETRAAVRTLGADLVGAIPEDRSVAESTIAGRPLATSDPGGPATAAFPRVAERLRPPPEPIDTV